MAAASSYVLVNHLSPFSDVDSLVQPAQSPTSLQHCAPLKNDPRGEQMFACLHGWLHCASLLYINTDIKTAHV